MPDLPSLCEQGQSLLERTDYLGAERALMQAERIAWDARDWDTLSRLYMPLQEARRQIRQRCGEGVVCLDLIATPSSPLPPPEAIVERYPHGQLLVAGEADIGTAVAVRRLARERGLYVETFLAAVYPIADSFVVAIVPTDDARLPPAGTGPIDRVLQQLPPFSIVLGAHELTPGERRGTDATYAQTMAIWETLHRPFLTHAQASGTPELQMSGYRRTIEVDPACELAHQYLSIAAGRMTRRAP